ncbi:pleckstrin homology domain-containing family O member 1 isoform X2 [Macaca thibetana thibetana]|uniref:pleckstrin homology domain-containing family O member 1 isoform X2 n=1 Tax=Macaca thibetana thibetana TaxID=257877 RepID=UPI0021BCBECE|nr:pleckstrin homology domain-containing family O member 1 isoform X2 [Macaca thibetana thibetana]XP_050606312.1 pleckstrin homology domain-containing family O member 1 isoform X2 [Macaca thibetana thibetana]
MAVASTSTSDGMLTLDLIQEEDPSPEEPTSCAESFRVDLDKSVAQLAGSRRRADSDRIQPSADRASSLSRPWEKPDKGATYTPQAPKKLTPTEKGRCASLEEILSQRDAAPARTLQLQAEEPPSPAPPHPGQLSRIQDLVARKLEKTQELLAEVQGLGDGKRKAKDPPRSPPDSESEQLLLETERLLGEASSNWNQAKRVLQEVRELRDLYRQMDLQTPDSHLRQTTPHNEAKGSTLRRPKDGETGGNPGHRDIKAMTANSPFLLRFLTSGGKTSQWHSLLSYVLGMQPPPSSGCRGPHSAITAPHTQSRLIQQLETLRARRFQEVPNLPATFFRPEMENAAESPRGRSLQHHSKCAL